MQIKIILFILFFLLNCCTTITAQSIYFFTFKSKQAFDTTRYEVFFFTNETGTGTVRVRYISPITKEFENIDAQLKEEYLKDEAGFEDANNISYHTVAPKIYPGKSEMPFKKISFFFSLNQQTNFLEPFKIIFLNNKNEEISTLLETAELLEKKTLTPKFVSDFYSGYDPDSVSANLFKKTRALSSFQRDSRIHLVLVANTTDVKIGANGAADIKKMEETFYLIEEYLGIKPTKIFRIAGQRFNKKNIEILLTDSLQPKPNDIVVFYYTGHGFRKPGKDSIRPYPFLDFTTKKDADYYKESMNIEDIFLQIKQKGARLNLVLSDCCNADFANVVRILGLDPNKRSSNLEWSIDHIGKLFASPQKVSILATAAGKNQLASTNPALGGFYTNYFLTAMKTKFEKNAKNISWAAIFEEARSKTIYKAARTRCSKNPDTGCEQYPIWKPVR